MPSENSSIASGEAANLAESAYEIKMVADTGKLSQLAEKCKRSKKISLETAYGNWRAVDNCRIPIKFDDKELRIVYIHYSKNGSPNGIKGITTDPDLISYFQEQYGRENQASSKACARFGSTTIPTLTIVAHELCEPLSYQLL
jgi:hypothetical protein